MPSLKTTSKIFNKGINFDSLKINSSETKKVIDETVKKQLEVLKLKELDKEKLKMIVQM